VPRSLSRRSSNRGHTASSAVASVVFGEETFVWLIDE
jgi:hypothetical protein